MQWSSEGEAIFKATVENDLPLLKLRIENGDNVNAKNDEVIKIISATSLFYAINTINHRA